MSGGGGNDILTGGTGADVFSFQPLAKLPGLAHVTDFNATDGDKLALNLGNGLSYQVAAHQVGDNVLVQLTVAGQATVDVAVLDHVKVENLGHDWYI